MLTNPKAPHFLTLVIAKAFRFLDINERRAITVRGDPDSEHITVSPEASWDDLEEDGRIYYLMRAELARVLCGEALLFRIEPLYRSEMLFSPLIAGEPANETKEAQKEEQEEASLSPPAPPPMSLS